MKRLELVRDDIVSCARCPRLVESREMAAVKRRSAFPDDVYWSRAVPGFGDPDAELLVVGLAPAAHGANRTGRMFTGDRSGDWLFSALYRAGYANQPTSTHQDDGLRLIGAYVTAAVHCAPPNNQPTIEERNDCSHFLKREIGLLKNARVILVLGGFACRAVASVLEMKPLPKFGHGVEVSLPNELKMLCSYHPSQRNTFTQRLTEQMFEDVFTRTREMTGKRLAE